LNIKNTLRIIVSRFHAPLLFGLCVKYDEMSCCLLLLLQPQSGARSISSWSTDTFCGSIVERDRGSEWSGQKKQDGLCFLLSEEPWLSSGASFMK